MKDDPDPHGHTYLVLPGGSTVDVSHHADPFVNPAQVAWMVTVLNHALGENDIYDALRDKIRADQAGKGID